MDWTLLFIYFSFPFTFSPILWVSHNDLMRCHIVQETIRALPKQKKYKVPQWIGIIIHFSKQNFIISCLVDLSLKIILWERDKICYVCTSLLYVFTNIRSNLRHNLIYIYIYISQVVINYMDTFLLLNVIEI